MSDENHSLQANRGKGTRKRKSKRRVNESSRSPTSELQEQGAKKQQKLASSKELSDVEELCGVCHDAFVIDNEICVYCENPECLQRNTWVHKACQKAVRGPDWLAPFICSYCAPKRMLDEENEVMAFAEDPIRRFDYLPACDLARTLRVKGGWGDFWNRSNAEAIPKPKKITASKAKALQLVRDALVQKVKADVITLEHAEIPIWENLDQVVAALPSREQALPTMAECLCYVGQTQNVAAEHLDWYEKNIVTLIMHEGREFRCTNGVEALLNNVQLIHLDRCVEAMESQFLPEDSAGVRAELSEVHRDLPALYDSGQLDNFKLKFWLLPEITFDGVITPPFIKVMKSNEAAGKCDQARSAVEVDYEHTIASVFPLRANDPLLENFAISYASLSEKTVEAAAAVFNGWSKKRLVVVNHDSTRDLVNGYSTLAHEDEGGVVKAVASSTRIVFQPTVPFGAEALAPGGSAYKRIFEKFDEDTGRGEVGGFAGARSYVSGTHDGGARRSKGAKARVILEYIYVLTGTDMSRPRSQFPLFSHTSGSAESHWILGEEEAAKPTAKLRAQLQLESDATHQWDPRNLLQVNGLETLFKRACMRGNVHKFKPSSDAAAKVILTFQACVTCNIVLHGSCRNANERY
jgi:hypothetical protein